jgi:hypothetical protein
MFKQAKMFIYLPIYLAEKKIGRPPAEGFKPEYVRTVIKEMPPARIEVGDLFIAGKRNVIKEIVENTDGYKVEQVKYSLADCSCIVVLEKIVFEKKEEVTEFLKNKRSVI